MGDETKDLKLIDSINGFNELSRLAMLWTVRHHWPLGVIFALNCYKHEAKLIVHWPAALFRILTSREGVTQGDPLLVVLYRLALLPLAEAMRGADPGVLQPWYTNNAVMRVAFRCNSKLLRAFM